MLLQVGNLTPYYRVRRGAFAPPGFGARGGGGRVDKREGKKRPRPSHSPSLLHSDTSRISSIATATGTERLTSNTPGMCSPPATRRYAYAVTVLTSCCDQYATLRRSPSQQRRVVHARQAGILHSDDVEIGLPAD